MLTVTSKVNFNFKISFIQRNLTYHDMKQALCFGYTIQTYRLLK